MALVVLALIVLAILVAPARGVRRAHPSPRHDNVPVELASRPPGRRSAPAS